MSASRERKTSANRGVLPVGVDIGHEGNVVHAALERPRGSHSVVDAQTATAHISEEVRRMGTDQGLGTTESYF